MKALHLRFSSRDSQEHRDLVSAGLLDFETAAVHEISATEWRVFFRSADERDRTAAALAGTCDVALIEVEDEDWAKRSQQGLKAIQVGNLVIAPPWDIPANGGGPQRPHPASGTCHPIVIEPSTGFGTGHHETTRLCLRALQARDLRGKRVLDVGTGSGILAIAAARLGAASVTAVDNDADAIEAANRNARRNSVRIELLVGDLDRTPLPPADIVLANLTGAMLQRAAATLAWLARGGVLIVSGLLDGEEAAVSRSFAPFVSSALADHESGWCVLTLTVR